MKVSNEYEARTNLENLIKREEENRQRKATNYYVICEKCGAKIFFNSLETTITEDPIIYGADSESITCPICENLIDSKEFELIEKIYDPTSMEWR